MKWLALPLMALGLAACSSVPKKSPSPSSSLERAPVGNAASAASRSCVGRYSPAQEDPNKRGDYQPGGLYAAHIPDTTPDEIPDVDCIAEPVVTDEPRSPIGNRSPYSVLGKNYQVLDRVEGYVERGTASYYGNKFHGRRTSNQEVYDMYAFTAAHKTLPLPSFARVTNLDNGKSVVVRINDRGPFHEGRVIDLSYAAAVKLGITARGTGRVEVRALTRQDQAPVFASTQSGTMPVKTTIATGIPTRIATGKPTPMDALVDTLPQANNAVASNGPVGSPGPPIAMARALPSQPWRYQVSPELQKKPSADEFDAWMQSRGVNVATGKPVAMARTPRVLTSTPAQVLPNPQSMAISDGTSRIEGAAGGDHADDVQLQVASFASRENADRALARLSAAGIPRATLSDVASNGRTMWRLRVGADKASAPELAGRIANLGFGQPQIVRE